MSEKRNQRKAIPVQQLSRKLLIQNREVRWQFKADVARLEFANQLKNIMSACALSQAVVAERSGTTQPMVSRLLRSDDDRSPTLETMVKVADALDHDVRVHLQGRIATECYWPATTRVAATPTDENRPWESGGASRTSNSAVVVETTKWASAPSPRPPQAVGGWLGGEVHNLELQTYGEAADVH